MSDTLQEHDSVFGGGKSEETDWKKKYEQLERDLASARVEQGRVKKLDEEKKALEKELSELRSRNERENMLSALSAEERDNIAPEVLSAMTKLQERQRAEYERRFEELSSRTNMEAEEGRRNAKENFARRIDEAFPGFLASVGNGGPNADAWNTFKRTIGRYIDQAYANLDFDGVSYFIRRFYSEIGSEVPSAGLAGSSAPDPDAVSGGIGGIQGGSSRIYTPREISEAYDRIEQYRMEENYREARRLEAEIDRAIAENRVRAQ